MLAPIVASAFFLITLAISFNNGSFNGSFVPIIILFISFISLLILFLRPSSPAEALAKAGSLAKVSNTFDFLPYILISTFATFPFFIGGWWAKNLDILGLLQVYSSILLLPIIFFSLTKIANLRIIMAVFFLFVAGAAVARFLMLVASPSPVIDVFVILKEAPIKLLAGINPYDTTYTYVFPDITPDYYAYWPASILVQIPFVLAFKDPRVLMILADIGAGLLLFLIGGKTFTASLISLIYLFRPLSLFIIEASWLTPLDFFFVTLIIYALMKKAHPAIVGILLGILTSVQFFFAILLIFLGKFTSWNKYFLLSFLTTTAAFVIPFILALPQKFIAQTLLVYLQDPPHRSILVHTSLSLNTIIHTLFGFDIPGIIIYALIVFVFAIIFFKQKKDIISAVGGFTLFFFATFIFGRQAFVNYYYLVASFLLLWLALIVREQQKEHISQKE